MFLSHFRPMSLTADVIKAAMPEFSGTRIMMMPVIIGELDGIPERFHSLMKTLFALCEGRFFGEVGYLTIDERDLKAGDTLRRPGLHVDGVYNGRAGSWGGGGWGPAGNGMLTVSNTSHCKAYLGLVHGEPGLEGECDQVDLVQAVPHRFEANKVYWVDGLCVHESLPVETDQKRQFIRLSMPNKAPWFEGYTKNPAGVMPTGDILPARTEFMSHGSTN